MKKIAFAILFSVAALPLVALAQTDETTTTVGTGVSAGEATAAGGVLAAFGIFFLILAVIALVSFIYWLVMVIDALKRKNWETENDKTTWVLVLVIGFVFGFGLVAAIIYHILVKHKLDKAPGSEINPVTPPENPLKK